MVLHSHALSQWHELDHDHHRVDGESLEQENCFQLPTIERFFLPPFSINLNIPNQTQVYTDFFHYGYQPGSIHLVFARAPPIHE